MIWFLALFAHSYQVHCIAGNGTGICRMSTADRPVEVIFNVNVSTLGEDEVTAVAQPRSRASGAPSICFHNANANGWLL